MILNTLAPGIVVACVSAILFAAALEAAKDKENVVSATAAAIGAILGIIAIKWISSGLFGG